MPSPSKGTDHEPLMRGFFSSAISRSPPPHVHPASASPQGLATERLYAVGTHGTSPNNVSCRWFVWMRRGANESLRNAS